MADNLTIQQITDHQFEPALALLVRFLGEEDFHTPPDQIAANLRAMIAHPATAVFMAWRDEIAIAVATVRYSPSIEHGYYGELEDLYVLPEARGGGVAKAVIEYVCGWCHEHHCSRVEVCVTPEGEAAHRLTAFYAKLGFAPTDRDLLYRPL